MRVIIYSLFLIFATQFAFCQKIKENTLSKNELSEGWVLLFDGTTTNGWITSSGKPVPTTGWEVKNGCITTIKGAKGGDIITKDEYKDFIFSVDFNIEPGCNSGIKYFYTEYPNGGNLGMEFQIIDDQLGKDNKKDNHLIGSFYDVLAPTVAKKKVFAPGQWNNIRIVSKGMKVEHWLNDQKVLEFTRGSKAYTEAVAKSKFSKTEPAFGMVEKGHILLQEHGGQVSFRNIK